MNRLLGIGAVAAVVVGFLSFKKMDFKLAAEQSENDELCWTGNKHEWVAHTWNCSKCGKLRDDAPEESFEAKGIDEKLKDYWYQNVRETWKFIPLHRYQNNRLNKSMKSCVKDWLNDEYSENSPERMVSEFYDFNDEIPTPTDAQQKREIRYLTSVIRKVAREMDENGEWKRYMWNPEVLNDLQMRDIIHGEWDAESFEAPGNGDTPKSLAYYDDYCVVCGGLIGQAEEATMDEYGFVYHKDCIITDAIREELWRQQEEFERNAESKKLPPVEKAIDTGIASGATMEGLDLALAAEWADEHPCDHCGSTDIDYGNNWKCHDCGRYAAEAVSVYYWVKTEMEKRHPMTEPDLEQLLEMLSLNVPVPVLENGMEQAEDLRDEPTYIILHLAHNKAKFIEKFQADYPTTRPNCKCGATLEWDNMRKAWYCTKCPFNTFPKKAESFSAEKGTRKCYGCGVFMPQSDMAGMIKTKGQRKQWICRPCRGKTITRPHLYPSLGLQKRQSKKPENVFDKMPDLPQPTVGMIPCIICKEDEFEDKLNKVGVCQNCLRRATNKFVPFIPKEMDAENGRPICSKEGCDYEVGKGPQGWDTICFGCMGEIELCPRCDNGLKNDIEAYKAHLTSIGANDKWVNSLEVCNCGYEKSSPNGWERWEEIKTKSFSADGKSKSGECYSCGEKGIHALSKKLTEDGNCPNCGALQEICDECGITGNPDVGWEGHGGIEIGVFVEAYDNEGKRISPKDAPEVGEGSFCIPCVEKWRKMGVRFEYDEWGAESFSAESDGDKQLDLAVKRTKMSAVRTGLAITTFSIVMWNLWTNKKQEKDIADIMAEI